MSTILITGATDGIGLATARLALDAGHELLLHARNQTRADEALAVLEHSGADTSNARWVLADLTDLDQIRAMADQIQTVDVVLHNAGIYLRQPLPDSAQGYEPTFAVNVLAPHLLTRLLRDQVRERVVFVASDLALRDPFNLDRLGEIRDPAAAYGQAKAAVVLMSEGWSAIRPDLTVGVLHPGWVPTKLSSANASGSIEDAARLQLHAATSPSWTGGNHVGNLPGIDDAATVAAALVAKLDARIAVAP